MNKAFANLLHTPPLFNALELASKHFQVSLLKFYREPEAVAVIDDAFGEAGLGMNPLDAYALYSLVGMQANTPGSMAEIGMWRGGSAKIICHLKGTRNFMDSTPSRACPAVARRTKNGLARNNSARARKASLPTSQTFRASH
jgi:hypothetical protein